jgi:hypothetical protein
MRKIIASCSAALIAIAVLGACGSSASSKSSDTNAPGTTNGSSGGTSPGASGSELSQLYANASKQKFKITFTDDSGDTQVYEQDGQGNSVWNTGDSKIFTTSSGSATCTTDSNGKAQCLDTGATGLATNLFLTYFNLGKSYVTALGGNFGDTSSKTVAGRSADCVKLTAASFGAVAAALAASIKGSLTFCVDKQTGVLLEWKATDNDGKTSSVFEVTKFEEPADSDFTLPATPQTIPSVSIPNVSIPSVSLPPGITIPGQ